MNESMSEPEVMIESRDMLQKNQSKDKIQNGWFQGRTQVKDQS